MTMMGTTKENIKSERNMSFERKREKTIVNVDTVVESTDSLGAHRSGLGAPLPRWPPTVQRITAHSPSVVFPARGL